LNVIERFYVNLIFKIFRYGITSSYGNDSTNSPDKNYQKMLKKKNRAYQIFNSLTQHLKNHKNSFFIEVNFKNFRFFIRPLILSDIIMTTEAWEPYVKTIFDTKKNDVIIDVGAHIGTYAIPKAKEVGKGGRVIAVEPHPDNVKILKKNIEINDLTNVDLIPKAANSNNEILDLNLSSDPMLSTIGKNNDGSTIKVQSIKLDSLLMDLSLEKVDWLKIDAEGYELKVLEGSQSIIEKFSPKIIIETRNEHEDSMKKFLEGYGYKIRYLAGEYYFAEKNFGNS